LGGDRDRPDDLQFQIGRTTHDQIMRAIEIVGEKVIPRFAD
jgi:hypothetical protein